MIQITAVMCFPQRSAVIMCYAVFSLEYAAIDSMLDQINSCLDDIEERNDALNGKLQELLESNRAARRDFRQQITDHADLPPPANDDDEEEEESRDAQKKD